MQPSPYKDSRGQKLCNPRGWYWSVKLDGMKGRWIGGKMYTRSGQRLRPPRFFRRLLPSFDVEGELYLGPKQFHRCAGLRCEDRESRHRAWHEAQFHIFDCVDYRLTWTERQAKLRQIKLDGKHIFLVDWQPVRDYSEVEEILTRVTARGEEGIVLADPKGRYENGHVKQMVKYKTVQDHEAVVVGYNTDDTKQRLASLEVKGEDGVRFRLGTGLKSKQRYDYTKQFPLGCTVTYAYEQLGKNGKPRTPILKGVRVDTI